MSRISYPRIQGQLLTNRDQHSRFQNYSGWTQPPAIRFLKAFNRYRPESFFHSEILSCRVIISAWFLCQTAIALYVTNHRLVLSCVVLDRNICPSQHNAWTESGAFQEVHQSNRNSTLQSTFIQLIHISQHKTHSKNLHSLFIHEYLQSTEIFGPQPPLKVPYLRIVRLVNFGRWLCRWLSPTRSPALRMWIRRSGGGSQTAEEKENEEGDSNFREKEVKEITSTLAMELIWSKS